MSDAKSGIWRRTRRDIARLCEPFAFTLEILRDGLRLLCVFFSYFVAVFIAYINTMTMAMIMMMMMMMADFRRCAAVGIFVHESKHATEEDVKGVKLRGFTKERMFAMDDVRVSYSACGVHYRFSVVCLFNTFRQG